MPPTPTWAQPKTLAEWRDRILKSLGGAHWNVELDEPSIDHAIWQTLILFNKYRPCWRWRPLGRITGKQEIDLSEEVETGVRVVEVKFMRDSQEYFRPEHRPYFDFHGHRSPRRVFKHLAALDRYNFFLGATPLWKYNEETKVLLVNTKSHIGVLGTALLLVPLRVEDIPFHLEKDFLDGATGYAKLILARILGKFGDIPAAQGNISTDASSLRTEGKDTVDTLERRLDRNLRHLPPQPIYG